MSLSVNADRFESVMEKVKGEKKRVKMMEEQLDSQSNKEILLAKSELVGLMAKSKFLEQYFLNSMLDSGECNTEDLSPEDSLNFGLTGILTLAYGEQKYTDELEEALEHSFKVIRVKDEEISTLEERISTVEDCELENLQSLKQDVESLKDLCEMYQNRVKKYKDDNQKHREAILQLESQVQKEKEKIKLLKNINHTQNIRIQNLRRELEKKQEEFKSLEKIAENVENDSYKKISSVETSPSSEKFALIIESLKEENRRIAQESDRKQLECEEKWERENYLYEKTKEEFTKSKETLCKLQSEIFELEEEKKFILENSEKKLRRVRSETAEILAALREDKRNLQRKLKEIQSKDYLADSEEVRPSLKEEFVKRVELSESFVSVCEFEDVVQGRFVSEEFLHGYKEKIEKLEKEIEEMQKELQEKDEVIVRLRGGRDREDKSRPSILLRVVANPIVLKLFRKN